MNAINNTCTQLCVHIRVIFRHNVCHLFHSLFQFKTLSTIRCQEHMFLLPNHQCSKQAKQLLISHWKHNLMARIIPCSPTRSPTSSYLPTYCHCLLTLTSNHQVERHDIYDNYNCIVRAYFHFCSCCPKPIAAEDRWWHKVCHPAEIERGSQSNGYNKCQLGPPCHSLQCQHMPN